jgi:succinate dehydrogenase/fumarate reductase flavoprotein subunit
MEGTTRRDFLKQAGIVTAGVAVSGGVIGALSPKDAEATPWLPPRWDKEVDVVVVGWGGAGSVAALTAAENGASVLLLEKAPQGKEGGNTRVSANLVFNPLTVADATTYLKAMCADYKIPDAIVTAWATMMNKNYDWVRAHGGKVGAGLKMSAQGAEYPEMAGAACAADGIANVGVASEGQSPTETMGHSPTWKFMQGLVLANAKIEPWYASPAIKLIQNPTTKEIIGVEVNKNMTDKVYVAAHKAVVLTCGGFAGNAEMLRDYLHLQNAYTKGTPYNTGDGIKMAQDVGADLWHMDNMAGPDLNFKAPTWDNFCGAYTVSFGTKNAIYVGADATRFVDESISFRHGKYYRSGVFVPCPTPQPVHVIFDESARLAGPVYGAQGTMVAFGWAQMVEQYAWSADNSKEVAAGWIKKADTIEALAALINKDPVKLKATIDRYNGFCDGGADPDFGRPATGLKKVITAPFYAMELVPGLTNTQGGPRKNEKCEILDLQGQPIPRLYSAGELGEFYSHCYNGGGNVGATIAFGRVAGENAAKQTSVVNAKHATSILMKASAASARHGHAVKLIAALAGDVPAGTKVSFEVKAPGTKTYKKIASVGVTALGGASKSFTLTKKGSYAFRARYAGDSDFGASTSSSTVVKSI